MSDCRVCRCFSLAALVIITCSAIGAAVALATPGSWSDRFDVPPIGQGVDGPAPSQVIALATWDGALIAGGDFVIAGDASVSNLARWDDPAWSDIGGGVDGTVTALATYEGDLVVAGAFTLAGGLTVNHVARWDGTSWHALGSGTNDRVSALVVFEGDLIAGGYFTEAGGVPAPRIARWDGSTWTALGDFEGRVEDLDVYHGQLIAAGLFDAVDGLPVNHIAKWNGTSWSDLSGGLDGRARAITVHTGLLFAGGLFTAAGAVPAANIAAWDGNSWTALGSGLNGEVRALRSFRNELIAGGFFTQAGEVDALHVARWDDAAWSSLGSGTDDVVWSLIQEDGHLFAGGRFSSAGANPAARIARWDDDATPPLAYGVAAEGSTAFRSIQDAVEAVAAVGDSVIVESGMYGPVVVRKKQVEIHADSSALVPTITSVRWENLGSYEDPTGGSLKGFLVSGDVLSDLYLMSGLSVEDCTISGRVDLKLGDVAAVLRVANCTVAGGITTYSVGDEDGGRSSLSHCVVTGAGSDIVDYGREAWVTECTVLDGWISLQCSEFCHVSQSEASAGIYVSSSNWNASVNDCVTDGAITGWAPGSVTLSGNEARGILAIEGFCLISDNVLPANEDGVIADSEVGADVRGNVIVGGQRGILAWGLAYVSGNTVVGCGQGIVYGEHPSQMGEVFLNVVVECGTGISVEPGTDPELVSCNDVWNNDLGWSGLPDQTGSNGNLSADPLFCAASLGDYSVAESSPCLPGNHPDGCNESLIGALGEGCADPVGVDPPAAVADAGSLALSLIHPNPATEFIAFEVSCAPNARLSIDVIDVAGRQVASIHSGVLDKGTGRFIFPRPQSLPSGVYMVRAAAPGLAAVVRRVVVLDRR